MASVSTVSSKTTQNISSLSSLMVEQPSSGSWYITISNHTSGSQSYVIFAKTPVIKFVNSQPQKIYTNVIAAAKNVQNATGTARFMFRKQLSVVCGRRVLDETNGPENDTIVEVADTRSVSVGVALEDGTTTPGTQWSMQIAQGQTPFFSMSTSSVEEPGAFGIVTGDDFTSKDAKSRHYYLGYGTAMNRNVGPFVIFVPAPNETYTINQPPVFYILAAKLEAGDVLSETQIKAATEVAFDTLGVDAVKFVHSQDGKLVLVKPGPEL